MHRFGISNYEFVKNANSQNLKCISISVGVKQTDIDTLQKIAEESLRVDYITIDIAHGHSILMKNTIAEIKKLFGDKTFIIAGNVATPDAVKEITEWGADAIKVGIGQGSPCTTKDKTGFTMPMFSCMLECAKDASIPLIADGGVKCNGDVAKAMCAGADMVMVGGMFAECVDSPAENITKTLHTGFFKNEDYRPNHYRPEYKDVCYKRYYGSASQFNKGHTNNIEGVMREVPCNDLTCLEKLQEITMDLQSSVSYGWKQFEMFVKYRIFIGMTDYQRSLLESNLKKFKSFMEFVKFTYAHDIEFDHDEWVEFRDRYFDLKKNGSEEIVDIKMDNLILP